jgi:HEAT repeat protein
MTTDLLAQLIQAVAQDNDDEAEELVAQLDHTATASLQAMLSTTDPNVRWWAVRALAALQADPPVFVQTLQDPNAEVRACAALALANVPHPSTVRAEQAATALADHLSDPHPQVRNLCSLALARIGEAASPALVRVLEQNQMLAARILAARALQSAATTDAIPALVHALDDDSATIQYFAENALERLGVGLVLLQP